MKIGVIGAGSFGTAASIHLAKNSHSVDMWCFEAEEAEKIQKERENKALLPGAVLPDSVCVTNDIKSAAEGKDLIVTVVPSFATRMTARALAPHIKSGQRIVNLSKGLEDKTLLRLSEVYSQEIPNAEISVMSGPSHAEEIAKALPTTCVVASDNKKTAEIIQDIFMNNVFRVYRSDDKIGVEIGAALKNVIALCAGISDGLGYGDNTKAALITRGIAEIKRLGTAIGGKAETFSGLSGIGDLIVTCTSMHSRNRRCGILIGKGDTLNEAKEKVGMVVEGVYCAKAALALGIKHNVSMPIVCEANKVLFENKSPRDAVNDLMMRDKTFETN